MLTRRRRGPARVAPGLAVRRPFAITLTGFDPAIQELRGKATAARSTPAAQASVIGTEAPS